MRTEEHVVCDIHVSVLRLGDLKTVRVCEDLPLVTGCLATAACCGRIKSCLLAGGGVVFFLLLVLLN